jgi:hypothetical protein
MCRPILFAEDQARFCFTESLIGLGAFALANKAHVDVRKNEQASRRATNVWAAPKEFPGVWKQGTPLLPLEGHEPEAEKEEARGIFPSHSRLQATTEEVMRHSLNKWTWHVV